MKNATSTQARKWGSVARKLVAATASAALAVAMVPAAALADGSATYTLPTTKKAISHSDGTKFLSSGIKSRGGGWNQSQYYLMGINGINFDRPLRPGNVDLSKQIDKTAGTITTSHVSAAIGIMGTDVNVEPDEYLYNSAVTMRQTGTNPSSVQNGKIAAADVATDSVWINAATSGDSGANASWGGTVSVSVDGVDYDMPSIIFYEANFITSSDFESESTTLDEWVAIEKKRTGNDYNPVLGSWVSNSAGIGGWTSSMYDMAENVDEAIQGSYDATKKKYMLTSRYVDANAATQADVADGKYASANAFVQKYEDFAKGIQYYLMAKIADKTIAPKTVAVVCGYDSSGGVDSYAVRVMDPTVSGIARSNNKLGGRISNAIVNFTTDFNEAVAGNADVKTTIATNDADKNEGVDQVKWYKASDIVKYADAIFVADYPDGNGPATNSAGEKIGVYNVDNANYGHEFHIDPLIKAQTAQNEASAGSAADVFYKYPQHLFGVWYAQGFENPWHGAMAAAWLYPEQFTSFENVMAYIAKNFWHASASGVASVVASTCADISMPEGTKFGADNISADYEKTIDAFIDEGNIYYLGNYAAIDKATDNDLQTYSYATLAKRYAQTLISAATEAAQKQATAEDTAAKATAAAKAAQQAASAVNAASVNKATVKAKDIKASASIIVLGKKVTKIAAKAFKGKKATILVVKSTKLKKAKIKNCLKGSKITVVQVPSSKKKAYKKIFTKKVAGKKVTLV